MTPWGNWSSSCLVEVRSPILAADSLLGSASVLCNASQRRKHLMANPLDMQSAPYGPHKQWHLVELLGFCGSRNHKDPEKTSLNRKVRGVGFTYV